ncbi:MAG: cytochrome C oxidase subunit IV family protein [Colwellia sp.]|nr:cytochrome C oxidase subunit IV family protein [Colwellia sp.]
MQNNKTNNQAFSSWLLLMILTIASIYLTSLFESRSLYIIGALAIVVIKGQQVVDVFMELNKAPRFWRLLLLSYVVLLPLVIAIIYLL